MTDEEIVNGTLTSRPRRGVGPREWISHHTASGPPYPDGRAGPPVASVGSPTLMVRPALPSPVPRKRRMAGRFARSSSPTVERV